MADWGDWDYTAGNGMRVGLDGAFGSVSNTSSKATVVVEYWTDNQLSYNDNQRINFTGSITGYVDYSNDDGSTAQLRATKTYNYYYASDEYGSSPGNRTFGANVSGVWDGATPSHSITLAIPARPIAVCDAPTGLAIVASDNDDQWRINWSVNDVPARPVDRSRFERYSFGGAATWETIGTTVTEPDISWLTSSCPQNGRYRARVRTENSAGNSGYAYSIYWRTKPAAVSDVVIARTANSGEIVTTWTNNAPYAQKFGFHLWEDGVDMGYWGVIPTPAVMSQTFSGLSVLPLRKVSVKSRVEEGFNIDSAYIESNEIDLMDSPSAPSAVTLTRLSDATGRIAVQGNVRTVTNSQYWQGLEYQVAVDDGVWSASTALGGEVTSIDLSGWAVDSKYAVRVRSTNRQGESDWVESAAVYTTPAAPTGGAGVRVGDQTQVELSVATAGAWGSLVRVERSLNNGSTWTELGSFAPAGTWTDTPGTAAVLYRFRTQTPTGVLSDYSSTLSVGVGVPTDFSGIPGVVRTYHGATRIRQIYRGTNRIWSDGEA